MVEIPPRTGSLALTIFYAVCFVASGNQLTSKCGSVLQGSTGAFTSPNYPNEYPQNIKCKWTIRAPKSASKITITFPEFNVEYDRYCAYDYVKVLDQNRNMVGSKLCGKKQPNMKIEVAGNTAYVILYSDDDWSETGFKAKFDAQKPPMKGDCDFDKGLCKDWSNDQSGDFSWTVGSGETPTVLTGPTTDHSGKGSYLFIESSPPRVKGNVASVVSSSLSGVRCMRFYYFMYNGLPGMGSLNVYVRDPAGQDTLIWSRSGNQGRIWKKAQFPMNDVPSFKIVIQGVVGNTEYSDIAIDDVSFSNEVCIEEGCNRQLGGPSGTFLSPNYPSKYPDDSRCTWSITGPVGTKNLVIKFHQFDLQADTRCSKDYLQVFNQKGKKVGPNYCGFYPDGFGVKVEGSSAKVSFTSDHIVTNKGFNASFEAILSQSKDDCDFDTSKCSWKNSKLDDFDWTINSGRTMSYFTGPRGDYLGLGKYAYIESSHRVQGERAHLLSGFMSGARCMHFVYSLHGIHMGQVNVLQMAANGRSTRLFSKAGDHERGWHKASVDIPDVGTQYNVVIEGVVGSGFTGDAAVDEISFTAGSCLQSSPSCGGYLTKTSGLLQSPNYPGMYPNDAVCEWIINPLPYYNQLKIAFTKFNVQWSQGCSKDSVEVTDGMATRIGEKGCGSLKDLNNKIVLISGSKGHVIFKSDSSKSGSGFQASYQVLGKRPICGGQFFGTNGNFSSPNYPNNYGSREICEWEITGTRHKWLEITFQDFAIDDTVVCYYNYMLVYDGIHGDEIGRYCGMHAPAAPIVIPGHVTNIRFATSQYGAARGFVADWRVIDPQV